MEFVGWPPCDGYGALVTRGDIQARAFYVSWLIDDRLMAGMHVNRWDEGIGPVQDLIRRGWPIDRRRLVDLAVPLTDTTRI